MHASQNPLRAEDMNALRREENCQYAMGEQEG